MSGIELNKIFAAVLLATIVAMVAGFASDILYRPQQLMETAIAVDVETAPAGDVAEASGPAPIAVRLADASASAGQGLTRACAACHTFDDGGPNRVGPNLWNVVGGAKAHIDGFNYSSAMNERAAEGGVWSFEELDQFLANPRGFLPGTSMSYAGMRDPMDRANLIAYMRSLSNDPVPLPEAEAEDEAADESES